MSDSEWVKSSKVKHLALEGWYYAVYCPSRLTAQNKRFEENQQTILIFK